jgi:hypothetical protein
VLPEHAEVLLVQADRVLQHRRLTALIGDGHVEILDLAEGLEEYATRLSPLLA